VQQRFIHDLAASPIDLSAFTGVIANAEDPDAAVATATTDQRRIVLAQVARRLRDAGFSDRVLRAYGYSCAMCGVQLRLIDAAHIVPVAVVDNDATSNGIALCALHHRAFDRSLISMDDKYRVVMNPERLALLKHEHHVGGLSAFKRNLKAILALPPALADRPNPDFVVEGNRVRGWKKFKRVA
jgi:putative restriction endonuclease